MKEFDVVFKVKVKVLKLLCIIIEELLEWVVILLENVKMLLLRLVLLIVSERVIE